MLDYLKIKRSFEQEKQKKEKVGVYEQISFRSFTLIFNFSFF